MKPASLLAIMLAFSGTALAEVTNVPVPEGGWSITFDSPPLARKQESKGNGDYSFQANSGRFNLSLFVEKPQSAGGSNKDCYQFYWPRGSRNPLIAKETILITETPKYVRVQYDIVTEFQGQPIRARNVNYYFVSHDKWVDVHISVIAPEKGDDAIFDTFDKSLDYGK